MDKSQIRRAEASNAGRDSLDGENWELELELELDRWGSVGGRCLTQAASA